MVIFALLLVFAPFCTAAQTETEAHFCKHAKTVIKRLNECKDPESCNRVCHLIHNDDDLDAIVSSRSFVLTGMPLFELCDSHAHMQTPRMYKHFIDDIQSDYRAIC